MGRGPKRFFRLFDTATGELVAEGTSRECGEAIGARSKAIYDAYYNYPESTYKGYAIEEITASDLEANAEAAKKWDRFMEPIRKKYGIPVRRLTEEALQ